MIDSFFASQNVKRLKYIQIVRKVKGRGSDKKIYFESFRLFFLSFSDFPTGSSIKYKVNEIQI